MGSETEAAETVMEGTSAAVSGIEIMQMRSTRREERQNPKKTPKKLRV